MRHKRILDIAADNPNASLEAVAEEVPSATADLVKNVLEEYGDPAKDSGQPVDQGNDQEMVTSKEVDEGANKPSGEMEEPNTDEEHASIELSTLTEKQEKTLREIAERPEATQRELAERFGVTSATICNRVNSIEGFEWKNRQAITTKIFDSETKNGTETSIMTSNNAKNDESVKILHQRIATLEQQLEDINTMKDSTPGLQDPNLAHKVLHACLRSEVITEEEELKLIKIFVQ